MLSVMAARPDAFAILLIAIESFTIERNPPCAWVTSLSAMSKQYDRIPDSASEPGDSVCLCLQSFLPDEQERKLASFVQGADYLKVADGKLVGLVNDYEFPCVLAVLLKHAETFSEAVWPCMSHGLADVAQKLCLG